MQETSTDSISPTSRFFCMTNKQGPIKSLSNKTNTNIKKNMKTPTKKGFKNMKTPDKGLGNQDESHSFNCNIVS